MGRRYVATASNTSGIGYRADMVTAADEEIDDTLDDKIDKVKDDFDYIIDGLNQLDKVQSNEILNTLNDDLQELIQQIAGYLS